MTFQEQLKLIRTTKKLSQEDLARLLGVSFATVNRWEMGTFKPSKMAQKLIDNFCKTNDIQL